MSKWNKSRCVIIYAKIYNIVIPISDTKQAAVAPEPSYELVDKSSDVKLENNPAYSISTTQDSSEDHHYDMIPTNNHAKGK